MKLVQKKCPSCGASLSIDSQATEVTCEYCKQKLFIEREENNKDFDSTDFCLHVSKYYDNKSKMSSKNIAIIVSVLIAVLFIGGLIISVSGDIVKKIEKSNSNSTSNIPEKTYVTDISQIDDKSLELFHKETEKKLNSEKTYLPQGSTETEWEYVGMYLLSSKGSNRNEYEGINKLYDVYKKSYTVENKKIEGYAFLEYMNLELSSDNIVLNSFSGKVNAPFTYIDNKPGYYLKGYESDEEIYNKVLRKQQDKYIISGTTGLYLEK